MRIRLTFLWSANASRRGSASRRRGRRKICSREEPVRRDEKRCFLKIMKRLILSLPLSLSLSLSLSLCFFGRKYTCPRQVSRDTFISVLITRSGIFASVYLNVTRENELPCARSPRSLPLSSIQSRDPRRSVRFVPRRAANQKEQMRRVYVAKVTHGSGE